jgi:HEAT repeat protein
LDYNQPYASPAAPLLVELLDDGEQQLRFNADHALYRMGEAGLPALLEGLRARSAAVRESCAQNLAELGPRSAGAVPALEECLSDPDEVVRRAAAGVLVRIRER